LLPGLLDRHALLEMLVEGAHQPHAISPRFAVHEHGVFDLFEQVARRPHLLARWSRPRLDLEIDELDALALTDRLLEPVVAGKALTAQVDDGAQAAPLESPDVVRRRLRGAPGLLPQTMLVDIEQAKNAVIDHQHVEVP